MVEPTVVEQTVVEPTVVEQTVVEQTVVEQTVVEQTVELLLKHARTKRQIWQAFERGSEILFSPAKS